MGYTSPVHLTSNSGIMGFPSGSVVKNLSANAEVTGLICGLGRSPREENDNPLQYSCPGNPMDRGAWQATVPGVRKEHSLAANNKTTR